MVVKTGGKRNQMARLLSPILDQHSGGVGGCLSFELFTAGDGVAAVRVKQQDASGVLTLIGVHTQTSKWRKYNLHADVEDYIRVIGKKNLPSFIVIWEWEYIPKYLPI